ncbi:MAG: LLM class F420-dependent oxidoreductase [Acidimicrobiia bacterium]
MRFGTFVPQGWKSDQRGVPVEEQWQRIVSHARLIEEVGFDSIWVYDHFHTHPVVSQESTFEAWTLMASLATLTERVRLGQMCTCALYRPPALLAKMASCIDVISGGRLDVGIGAGWSRGEFEAYGYRFPPAGERLDMLEESVRVLLAMWSADEATFEGDHHSVDGAINRPKPLQDPHPPLWIAGGGEKRTLRIVARYGDFANFGPDIDSFRHKSAVLAEHCRAVGRPFEEISRSSHRMSVIGRDEADLARKLEIAGSRRSCAPEEFRRRHFAVTIPQAADEMGQYIGEGCTDMILYFYDMGEADSLELFATEVIPQLR